MLAGNHSNETMLFVLFVVALAFQGQESGQGRMGAGSSGPSSEARADAHTSQPFVIQKFDPDYTPEALAAALQGTITLALVITPEGKASQISVVRSLGMGLDEKAVECVEKWRFRPAMRNGQPLQAKARVEINFRLPNPK